MSYYTCEGLSDLGNGPNQPSATIIGEYSASYHYGALIFTLVRARISGSVIYLTSDYIFDDTSLMSDRFSCYLILVKGCQTLVMDPTSLLQQSLVNTVPHTIMVH